MTKKTLSLLFAFIFCGALVLTGCSGEGQKKTAEAKINLSEAVDVSTYEVNGIPVTDGYVPFGDKGAVVIVIHDVHHGHSVEAFGLA